MTRALLPWQRIIRQASTISAPSFRFQIRYNTSAAMAGMSSLPAQPFSTAPINKHRDPTTLSNYEAWRTEHTAVDLKIDFAAQILAGKVSHTLKSISNAETRQVVLDTSYLDIKSINVNGQPRKWALEPRHPAYGSALIIYLDAPSNKDEVIKVDIDVSSTKQCTALQWLTPAQTSTKKHPYMFSQCQAIHARSLFPCQDSSDCKTPFDFRIQSPLQVLASGLPQGTEDVAGSSEKVYIYKQRVPIPPYLFALASGELVSAPIGPRSTVWTGPLELEAAKWELDNDTEKFIQIVEKLVFPYEWGEYNVLVLPPSFPYGGMENPIYTYLTPTAISGDKQNIDVIAHELSHSWSGNLITNASPELAFLNEGWTVYLERRIALELHGSAARDFSSIIGWKGLVDSVNRLGPESEWTQLVYTLHGEDPDDAYSQVQYEKGFTFLYYLENLIGMAEFDKFIRHYFTTWKYKSLDHNEFKATLIDFFTGVNSNDLIIMKLRTVDWDRWFYKPGLPPKPAFDTSLADVCYALADKWKSSSYKPSPEDIAGWTSSQVVVFLEAVQVFDEPLSAEATSAMGSAYSLLHTKNAELASRFYVIALRAGDKAAVGPATDFLGRIGRMKFVRPVYTWLDKLDRATALATFEQHKDFYHPICRKMVEKVLFQGGGEG